MKHHFKHFQIWRQHGTLLDRCGSEERRYERMTEYFAVFRAKGPSGRLSLHGCYYGGYELKPHGGAVFRFLESDDAEVRPLSDYLPDIKVMTPTQFYTPSDQANYILLYWDPEAGSTET
jgi:hypothetical protein